MLTYIEGEVAIRPWPEFVRMDSGIVQLGTFLRSYHRAITKYTPQPDAQWRVPDVKWQPGQIIRHGDLGLWNTVWKKGKLVGCIDWDFAEPGYPIEDVAQLAWYSAPLLPDKKCRETGVEPGKIQISRMHLLCQTYGIDSEEVIDTLIEVQQREIDRIIKLGGAHVYPWSEFLKRGDAASIKSEMSWLRENQAHFIIE